MANKNLKKFNSVLFPLLIPIVPSMTSFWIIRSYFKHFKISVVKKTFHQTTSLVFRVIVHKKQNYQSCKCDLKHTFLLKSISISPNS